MKRGCFECLNEGCVFCFCREKWYCFSCLVQHLKLSGAGSHILEVKPHQVTSDFALDLLAARVNLDPYLVENLKQTKVTVEDLLLMTPAQLRALCTKLNTTKTEEQSLWEELYYLKVVTGRVGVKSDPLTKLTLGLPVSENETEFENLFEEVHNN